jgi:hypothetical protein
MPAKAGTQGGLHRAHCPWTPAFAGATKKAKIGTICSSRTTSGTTLTLDTHRFRHSRESGNPEPAPGMNRGPPPRRSPWAPAFRGGDEGPNVGTFCLVRTTSYDVLLTVPLFIAMFEVGKWLYPLLPSSLSAYFVDAYDRRVRGHQGLIQDKQKTCWSYLISLQILTSLYLSLSLA